MPGLDFDTSDVLRNILAPAADDDASALLSAAIFRPNDITPKAFDFDKLTTVDVGAGSSGHPPKQTTVDGRTESLSKLPTRLLLDAWSKTYGPFHDAGACSEADAFLFGCGSCRKLRRARRSAPSCPRAVSAEHVHHVQPSALGTSRWHHGIHFALDARLTHSVDMRFASKRSSCGIGGALADDIVRHSLAHTRFNLHFDILKTLNIHFDPTSR